jgi:hypothetical protein
MRSGAGRAISSTALPPVEQAAVASHATSGHALEDSPTLAALVERLGISGLQARLDLDRRRDRASSRRHSAGPWSSTFSVTSFH